MSAIWTRFGLARTPFFQEPLELGAPTADLGRFFIGRAQDRQMVVERLSHDTQTRVVLVGDPGVGKTTLMNRVLADLREAAPDRAGWLVPELGPINLPGASTLADFAIEVLRQLLDLRRQHLARAKPAKGRSKEPIGQRVRRAVAPTTSLWDTVVRTVDGLMTVSPQIAGFGVTTQVVPPTPSAGQWVPLVRAALEALVEETDCDVLLAVNNAENLARAQADRAQDVLLDARDLFLIPRIHWLFVGTPDFFQRVIAPERRLAGIMQHPVILDPLSPADVRALLAVRYKALRLPGATFTAPVDLDAAAALAQAFVGDLRELLRSLEAAVLQLAHRGPKPVTLDDAVQVISHQQRELLRDRMQGAAWTHLVTVVLGATNPAGPAESSRRPPEPHGARRGTRQAPAATSAPMVLRRFREADAVRRLAPMKQASVNAHKQRWLADGLVRSDGRTGASEWLVVTGAALLAMLPEAAARGLTPQAVLAGRDLETLP